MTTWWIKSIRAYLPGQETSFLPYFNSCLSYQLTLPNSILLPFSYRCISLAFWSNLAEINPANSPLWMHAILGSATSGLTANGTVELSQGIEGFQNFYRFQVRTRDSSRGTKPSHTVLKANSSLDQMCKTHMEMGISHGTGKHVDANPIWVSVLSMCFCHEVSKYRFPTFSPLNQNVSLGTN